MIAFHHIEIVNILKILNTFQAQEHSVRQGPLNLVGGEAKIVRGGTAEHK